MGKTERDPSEILTDFLNYIDCCRAGYQAAQEAVRKEERRLQVCCMSWSLPEMRMRNVGRPRSCSKAGGNAGNKKMR